MKTRFGQEMLQISSLGNILETRAHFNFTRTLVLLHLSTCLYKYMLVGMI